MLARRSFLRALGLGAPAAIAAGSSVEAATGLRGGIGSLFGYGVSGGVDDVAGVAMADSTGMAQRMAIYLASNALPSFVTDRIRENARDIQRLDPDLAANRSFSLSTKMRIQAEREVKRATRQAVSTAKRNVLRTAFQKMHGFELW